MAKEPYVDRPMIDQNGEIVGTSRTLLRELLSVEVHVDEVGECWTPPTAWAYAQACRVREEKHAALTTAQSEAAELRKEVERWKTLHCIAVDHELTDIEAEDALKSEGIFTWGPDGERFQRMFAVVMKLRAALKETQHEG